jgi:glyoxylase-like metal-dependent hydrolase (beta-lactamase superfamily II)
MYFRQLELGPMANYVYLVGDPETKACAVVDPAWDAEAIHRAAEEDGYRIERLLITHGHHDHINAIEPLLARVDARVHVHEQDAFAIPAIGDALVPVKGGERLELGKLAVRCLHTPGHTEGSQCFRFEDGLMTGDTLFVRSCGRVDFENSDPEKMWASLKRLCELEDSLTVFPGHNYSPEKSVPLGVEKGQNRFLQAVLRAGPDEFRRMVGL